MYTRKSAILFTALMALPLALLLGAGDEYESGVLTEPDGPCWNYVIRPNTPERMQTYAELAGDWWRWVGEEPADRSPILDTTGEYAAEGQAGAVWYLAGAFGGKVERTITMPAGKLLFFPLINNFWFNCPDENLTVREMAAWHKVNFMKYICEIECKVDGKRVKRLWDHEAQSPPFGFTWPEDCIFAGGCHEPWPAGTYVYPCVADGYWMLLEPLRPGEHEVHFRGKMCDLPGYGDWEVEVLYHITVEEPGDGPSVAGVEATGLLPKALLATGAE